MSPANDRGLIADLRRTAEKLMRRADQLERRQNAIDAALKAEQPESPRTADRGGTGR